VGDYLRIGKGEEKSGGRNRSSNLADAMESVLGAAYLDGGVAAVERVFKKLFVPRLEELGGDLWAGNPKGELQEHCQRVWKQSPRYRVVRQRGPAHATDFTCEVTLGDGSRAGGKGRNKQAAEKDAARKALQMLANR
jgi:ribonuclease-3